MLWKQEELDFMKENYQKMTPLNISKNINRTIPAIYIKAKELKLQPAFRENYYNKKQLDFLIKNYGKITQEQIAIKLGKTLNSIKFQAYKLRKKGIKLNSKLDHSKNQVKKMGDYFRKLWKNPEYRNNKLNEMIKNQTICPTSLEKQINQINKLNKIPFQFIANKKIRIGKFYPDFINNKSKKIIEVYGEYHHNLPKVKKRDKKRVSNYKNNNFQTLIIKQKELKNPQKVTEKIVNFYIN